MVAGVTPALSISVMYSWCRAISGQVTCRNLVSANCGNHRITSAAQPCCDIAGPPGAMPAATAGARYLRIVLRSTPNDTDTSLIERPAYQWMKISVTSTTSNVLLAIGSLTRHPDEGGLFLIARTTTRRHARHPHGELRERPGGELRERQTATAGELRERRQLLRFAEGGHGLSDQRVGDEPGAR